jgi:murein DD-endopeptidase MepM/ murein hydrolase activator NlpD
LEAQVAPAYVFPVEGASPRDIWSVFGDSRGGGRRIHHGIDIFAPRGTILRAATDAYVARVGSRSLGGKIVTLYDQRRDIYLYYAHLEEWLVEEGSYVRAGDPVGRVGNTGNARYTPPHLHIGLYDGWWSRPIDPWNFFVSSEESRSVGKELAMAVLGERRELGAGVQARVYVDGVPIVETLSVDREVRVIGVSEEGARVVLEDGIPAIVSPEQLR